MAENDLVNEVPPDARPINGEPQTTVSLRPIRFTAASLWESPCFWIVVGSALTLLAIHALKRKG